MINEELNTALYEKMAAEQEAFRKWLLTQPPEEILNHCFEYTTREDILICVENARLSDQQCQALLSSPDALSDVYKRMEGWDNNGYMNDIENCMSEYADERAAAMLLDRIQKNSVPLESIPRKMRTAEVCMAAVQKDGLALEFVPLNLRTQEMCLAAVQQNGLALEFVPTKLRTTEMCLTAVRQDGVAMAFVPKEMRTEEMCWAAVLETGLALAFVPEQIQTHEMCLAAVQQIGLALRFVSEEMRTEEICMAAVRRTGLALDYVPEKHIAAVQFGLNHPELYALGIRPDIGLTEEQLGALSYGLNTGCKEDFIRELAQHPETSPEDMLEQISREGWEQEPAQTQPDFDWEE